MTANTRPAFAWGLAKSSATAEHVSVVTSTDTARAEENASKAQSEFDSGQYWSAWRDAGEALRLGGTDPSLKKLRGQAYVHAMAQENMKVSSAATTGKIDAKAPLAAASAKAKKLAPEQSRRREESPRRHAGAFYRAALSILAAILGLLVLGFFVFLASKSSSPKKPRREPGKGHVSAQGIPPASPLLKPGAMLGGRFILGSPKEEIDGVCVYDGRDLSDETMTIVRYPQMPGGVERARKAVDFKHPGVAQLRGVFAAGVHIFAVYESLRGDSLRRILERLPERRYSPEQALRLLKNLCDAFGAAHLVGIFHGPLAPGEIIISPSQVKVRGFGLWPLSALAYAAPEFSPQNGESTPSSDLFSLAACLYEMLTGKAAFFETRNSSSPALFVPPSQKAPALGPSMDEFFAKALAAEPSQRFAGAEEFFLAFSNLVVPKSAPSKDGKRA